MNPKIKDAVMASFIADALSLGVHWVYDADEIEKKYGRLEQMVEPELAPYHQTKQKGDFTHYGDQMMALFESVTTSTGFDLNHFSQSWQSLFSSYHGYMDHATKETLENFKAGKTPMTSGSLSADLGGAARIAPLALYYGNDMDAFVNAAVKQTAMTHNNEKVIDTAQFFARTAVRVFSGISPVEAMEASLEDMKSSETIHKMIRKGLESQHQTTKSAIQQMGQACSVQGALPSTIHLITSYENDLKEALVQNIMAGGDSSARGMLTGLILGAYQGLDGLPGQWMTDMNAEETILYRIK